MKIIRGMTNLKAPISGWAVTIGVFDGVHVAHKTVIEKLVKSAKAKGLKSVVVTFDPHPLKILNPYGKIPALISLAHRTRLIESLGVDLLVILNFTKSFAGLSAEGF